MPITSSTPASTGSGTYRLRVERIRNRAEQRGAHSVADMAIMFGISRQYMHALLRGSYKPSASLALSMAATLGIAVEDLFEPVEVAA